MNEKSHEACGYWSTVSTIKRGQPANVDRKLHQLHQLHQSHECSRRAAATLIGCAFGGGDGGDSGGDACSSSGSRAQPSDRPEQSVLPSQTPPVDRCIVESLARRTRVLLRCSHASLLGSTAQGEVELGVFSTEELEVPRRPLHHRASVLHAATERRRREVIIGRAARD